MIFDIPVSAMYNHILVISIYLGLKKLKSGELYKLNIEIDQKKFGFFGRVIFLIIII